MVETKSPSRITIADVARRAGLSIATVSRVINNTAPVSEETARCVRAAIAELHYVPLLSARQLASRKTGVLGLMLDEISGDFFSPMLRGVETGIREAGYDLLIASIQGRNGASVIGEHNTDGMLVFNGCLDEDELRRLWGTKFPMVLLYHTPPEDLGVPCVIFENKDGAVKMTDHLIEKCGYRRIAFLRGPEDNEDSYWREQGYRASLEAHGIPFDAELVATGGFDDHQAEIAVSQWLADGVKMEAIFAGDDESAIGAMLALRRDGLCVPEDVAVVGFDDIPMARHLTLPLTTVRAPIERAGYEGARQLVNLVEHDNTEPLIMLPTELVIRKSCGYDPDNAG